MTQNELEAVRRLAAEAEAVVNRMRVLAQTGRRIMRDDINVSELEAALYSLPKLSSDEQQVKRKARS